MRDLILGLGFVAVIEGLVLVLAPLRFEDVIEMLRKLTVDQRRMLGISLLALGVLIVWIAKSL